MISQARQQQWVRSAAIVPGIHELLRILPSIASHIGVRSARVNTMAGPLPPDDGEEILRMQRGVRDWVLRSSRQGEQGFRRVSPPVLLSLLCAAAFSPLLAVGAGITGAAAVAGIGVLSSVGSGVLTGVSTEALDRLRPHGEGRAASRGDLETEIARQIQQVLATGEAHSAELRAEIAAVLKEINVGGTALQEAFETGNESVRSAVVAAIGELSTGFDELTFLLGDVSAAAEEIQASQDTQGAQLRVIIDKVDWVATEARLTREEAAAWRTSGGLADVGAAGHGPRWAHGCPYRGLQPFDEADAEGFYGRGGRAAGGAAGHGPRWAHGCPYRGLQPFDEADAEVFYGRERLTAELVGRLAGQRAGTGILVVTGASGAGKSSLLRAGLLPALARGLQLPGSARWPRVVITPTAQPLAGPAFNRRGA